MCIRDRLSDEDEVIDYLEGLASLTDVVEQDLSGDFRVRRIGEPAQVDTDALTVLTEAGMTPGVVVQVAGDEDETVVVLRREGESATSVSLPRDVADHVFVEAVSG